LKISERAHLVLTYHKIEDQLSERHAETGVRLGTTSRGIGPCYADKMRRGTAVRFTDLLHEPNLHDRVAGLAEERRRMLRSLYGEEGEWSTEAVIAELATAREKLQTFVCDTTDYLTALLDQGAAILFEGANGVLLDIDHGTYPFVTSSSTGPHGIGAGAGVPAARVTRMIGTIKAYATRVGAGPFVSELTDEIGDRIRRQGNEFGTTTGRPRRCGWFDAVAGRHAVRVSGATEVAMMHLDTLTGFERIGVCTSYRAGGRRFDVMPAELHRLRDAAPVLEYLPGWGENLRDVRHEEDLPDAAKRYIEFMERRLGVPVSMIGVGPEREQTLLRGR
jgi:adenylosuccinate synthase